MNGQGRNDESEDRKIKTKSEHELNKDRLKQWVRVKQ